jgi:hypothetical protein
MALLGLFGFYEANKVTQALPGNRRPDRTRAWPAIERSRPKSLRRNDPSRGIYAYLWFVRVAFSIEMPFQAICTPMHMRIKAITRRMPWTVEGETALISLGA